MDNLTNTVIKTKRNTAKTVLLTARTFMESHHTSKIKKIKPATAGYFLAHNVFL